MPVVSITELPPRRGRLEWLMANDRNGQPVGIGDVVFLPCRVVDVAEAGPADLELVTVEGVHPAGGGVIRLMAAARQVVRQLPPEPAGG